MALVNQLVVNEMDLMYFRPLFQAEIDFWRERPQKEYFFGYLLCVLIEYIVSLVAV